MPSGPIQNYEDESLGAWRPRPVLAWCIRVGLALVPATLAVLFGLAAVRWLPAESLGMNRWVWLAAEVACATGLLLLTTRLTRRLLPMTTLLRLTVFFPDEAPSRLGVAMRHYSPAVLVRRLDAARQQGRPVDRDQEHASFLLDLVAAVHAHDQVTRGHCERVQGYAALIGTELGLSEQDAARLSWAALLHDVGKLDVPAEIITKPGRPTDEEWDVLATHPAAGAIIAHPLADWLGPWFHAIGQHHERWDGGGYPSGLAGSAISQGARIVAVADAFDTITSARSYKKSLPAAAARAELARCAGSQFDPEVVRAFLSVSLGRLRKVAGPLSVLSALPGLQSVAPNAGSLVPGASQVATTMTAVTGAGVLGLTLSLTGVLPPGDVTPPGSGLVLSDVENDAEAFGADPSDDEPDAGPEGTTESPAAAPTSDGRRQPVTRDHGSTSTPGTGAPSDDADAPVPPPPTGTEPVTPVAGPAEPPAPPAAPPEVPTTPVPSADQPVTTVPGKVPPAAPEAQPATPGVPGSEVEPGAPPSRSDVVKGKDAS
jgi:HD-GYP domain-containing protein (c-di-GMP phosphodiesterase class II)